MPDFQTADGVPFLMPLRRGTVFACWHTGCPCQPKMASFASIGFFRTLVLAGCLASSPGLAQEAVAGAPDVSSNRNTEHVEPERETAYGDSADALVPGKRAAVPVPPQKLHSIRVKTSDTKHRIEIRSMVDVPIARCAGSCSLRLPEGRYKAVYFEPGEGEHDFEFSLEGPGGIELKDRNGGAAEVGLTLGVVGPILIAAGYAFVALGFQSGCTMGDCDPNVDYSSSQRMVLGGLGAFALGAVVTPIGWVLWARNHNPRWTELSEDVSVAVVPNREGAVLGLSGRF
jgi:hypothetical protein